MCMLAEWALTSKGCCCPAQACVEQVVRQQVHVQQPVVACHCHGVTTWQEICLHSLQNHCAQCKPLVGNH
jgi:hypothetical protein